MGLYKEIKYFIRQSATLQSDGRTLYANFAFDDNLQQYGRQNKPLYLRSVKLLNGTVVLHNPGTPVTEHRRYDVGYYNVGCLDGTNILNNGYFQVNKDLFLYQQDFRPRNQPMLFSFPYVDFGYNFNLRGKTISSGDFRWYVEILSNEYLTNANLVVDTTDTVFGGSYWVFELVLGWNDDF